MRLHLFKETAVRVPRKKLGALFEAVTGEEGIDGRAAINLIMTTDAAVRKLNRRFRRVDRPTDVLSFNLGDTGEAEGTFGEIYIAVPTARRQATAYGGTLDDELLRLTCHGLLHLFGYDHHRPAEAKQMQARERHFLDRAEGRRGHD